MVDKPYMRVGLFLFTALLLFVSGVTHKQSPTLSVSRQVMSLRGMESSKASVATDIKIRPLREDKANFYPWMMELKEALRGRGLLGALFPEDGDAAKIKHWRRPPPETAQLPKLSWS